MFAREKISNIVRNVVPKYISRVRKYVRKHENYYQNDPTHSSFQIQLLGFATLLPRVAHFALRSMDSRVEYTYLK